MGTRIALAAFLSLAAAFGPLVPDEVSRKKLVDKMDRYYQQRFTDLSKIGDGRLGVSRITVDNIKKHGTRGGDPGYADKEWHTAVWIFGNKGKPLNPEKLLMRYHRLGSGIPQGYTAKPNQQPLAPALQIAAPQVIRGQRRPYTSRSGESTLEVRAVRLSQKACLSCHTSMKLGDPVALIVYATTPFKKVR